MKLKCPKCGKLMLESDEFSGLWLCVDFVLEVKGGFLKGGPISGFKCTGLHVDEKAKKEFGQACWEYVQAESISS